MASQASLPPDLVALEQRAQALHVNSVRFVALIELDLGGFPGMPKGQSFVLPIEGSGEASVSPETAVMTAGVFGHSNETRVIGNVSYRYDHEAATFDGGRPWVRAERARGESGGGIDPLTLGRQLTLTSPFGASGSSTTPASSSGSFGAITETFADAESVTEIGPEIVDGNPVTEFSATLDPASQLSMISPKLLKNQKLGPLSLQLYVSFAQNGLPMRTSLTLGAGAFHYTETIDILATEVPVNVKAPPSNKIISEPELKQLQAARARRLRRQLRQCLKVTRMRTAQSRHRARGPHICRALIVFKRSKAHVQGSTK